MRIDANSPGSTRVTKKSRGRSGPKTIAGKNRSRGNSRKHGLAALLLIRDRSARVEELTKIFLSAPFDASMGQLAQDAAVARVRLEEVVSMRASVQQLCIARGAAADKTPEVHNAEGILGSLEVLKSLARYERRALTPWFRCLDNLQNAKVERGYNYKL
jgi:hypothetical protein